MKKRLINFRNTEDYAYIDSKGRRGRSTAAGGILWSSCGSEGGGQGFSGVKPLFKTSTAYGLSETGRKLNTIGKGIFLAGTGWTATVFLAPIGIPTMMVGALFGAVGNSVYYVKFTKPCRGKKTSTWKEPTFEQVMEAYRKNNIVKSDETADPLESE